MGNAMKNKPFDGVIKNDNIKKDTLPVYEIYALKYAGPFTRPLAMCVWGKSWDETIQIN